MILDALEVIISYLSEMLNSDNCLYFRRLGHLHSLPQLVAETDQYILDHFEEISEQDAFFDLRSDELDALFASDDLKVWIFVFNRKLCTNQLQQKSTSK